MIPYTVPVVSLSFERPRCRLLVKTERDREPYSEKGLTIGFGIGVGVLVTLETKLQVKSNRMLKSQ
jgi:hypothetical protein